MPPIPHCCVACGRPAGTGQAACPYCGEAVYEPRGRRIARNAALILLTAGTPLFVWSRGCGAGLLRPAPLTTLDGVLLAMGVGLLLLPGRRTGILPSSRTARLWQVVRPLGGTWLLAAATLALVISARYGTGWSPLAVTLAIVLPAALAALPGLASLPWLGLAAGGLLAAAWR